MSDTYEINGVKITPAAGGYYDLNHTSLAEPERVRGKEKAEQRAGEIAKAAEKPEGSMDGQGDLPNGILNTGAGGDIIAPGDTRSAAERVQERDNGIERSEHAERQPTAADRAAETQKVIDDTLNNEKPKGDASGKGDDKDAQIAALKAQNASLQGENKALDDRMANIEAMLTKLTTVTTTDEPLPQVDASVPRAYTGQMDPKTKASLKQMGIEVRTIVLEENESIPPTGLFVGHNGKSYMIKPGEEVDVPDFILSVLDDAVMAAPIVDSTSQKVLGYRNRSKYPYRNITK